MPDVQVRDAHEESMAHSMSGVVRWGKHPKTPPVSHRRNDESDALDAESAAQRALGTERTGL